MNTKLLFSIPLILSTFIITLMCFLSPAHAESSTSPNIVLIISDDAGYADFGFQGSKIIETPNIDAIAKSGVTFTRGYVSAPVCAPSRAGLLTGRYQQRFSFERNLTTKEDLNRGIAQSEKTMGDHFKALGYRTAAIGKWHLGNKDVYHPNNRGFDHFYGLLDGSRDYFKQVIKKPADKYKVLQRNGELLTETTGYVTDLLTNETIDFIERNKTRPFFAYVSYTAVHTPMHAQAHRLTEVPQTVVDPKRRKLIAMTASLDDNIGRIIAKLDQLGLSENTLVVFLNDNGGALTNASINAPLRGYKGSTFEGAIRVPMVVKWPGHIKENSHYDQTVISLDLLPTLLAAANAKPIENTPSIDGTNLLPYLSGANASSPHESIFFKYHSGRAHIKGDWKWMTTKLKQADGSKKLFKFLFNLKNDPAEQNNLLNTHPEKVTELRLEWQDWFFDMPGIWTQL